MNLKYINKIFCYFIITASLSILFYYFKNLDENIFIKYDFFPWDSSHYKDLIKNFSLINNTLSINFEVAKPFNERIIFPILFKIISEYFDISLLNAALIINLISIIFSSFICYEICKSYNFKSKNIIIFILIFFLCWGNHLRVTTFLPGMSYGFETFLISLLCFFFFKIFKEQNKNKISYLLLIDLVIFINIFQRGLIIVLISFAPLIVTYFINQKKQIKKDFIHFFIFSLFSFILLKLIFFKSGHGDYSILKHVIKYSYHNLNIINFIYPFFLYLGPFVIFYVCFLFRINIKKKFSYILKNQANFFIMVILFLSIFLSKIAGNPDRPMLWFWNFYILIALYCYSELNLKLIYKLLMILIIILWSRVFVPSYPPLIMNSVFSQNQFVETNYDSMKYFGPNFLKKYKRPTTMHKIFVGLPYKTTEDFHEVHITNGKINLNCVESVCSPNIYISSYEYNINNIPFPLGYLHNNRDALVDDPIFGKYWVIYFLTIQWIIIILIFVFFINIKKIKNKR